VSGWALSFQPKELLPFAARGNDKDNKHNDGSQNQMEWLYSLNCGSRWSGATLFTVTDNDTWGSKSFTLPAALDGQSHVIVRLQKYANESNVIEVGSMLIFNNIELFAAGGGGAITPSP